MDRCRHPILLLLRTEPRKRCRHCHLTLRQAEIEGGYCPECYANDGRKRRDFDDVNEPDGKRATYRCEACGIQIRAG